MAGTSGDPLVGRKLHRHFSEAGIPAAELTVVQRADVVGETKTLPYATVQAIAAEGSASADQLSAALEMLTDFAADPASVCGSPRIFQAWSRRPEA